MRHVVYLALVLVTASCHDNDPAAPSPISATVPPPPVVTPDRIEYRATGACGGAPVEVMTSDEINGTTILPAVALPYVATVFSTQSELFVLVSASCNAVAAPGLVQVGVFINGVVFREAYAQGAGALEATASGTWRRTGS
jgi:hypothetical protein